MLPTWFLWALGASLILCVAVQAVILLSEVVLSGGWRYARTATENLVGALQPSARTLRTCGDDSPDLLEQEVRAKVDAKKLAFVRLYFSTVSLLLFIYSCAVIRSVFSGEGLWMSAVQDVVLVGSYVLILVYKVSPGKLQAKHLKYLYCVAMLLIISFDEPWAVKSMQDVLLQSTIVNLTTTLTSVLFCDVPLNLCLNLLCALSRTVTLSRCTGDAHGFILQVVVFGQLERLIGIVIMAYIMEASIVSSARREVEAGSARTQRGALKSLLTIMCDAVVELDSELAMVMHAPALANILLHGSGRSLEGMRLQCFMSSREDERLFEESVRVEDASKSLTATVFHARVKDSMGNRIKMQFFHVPFFNIGDQLRHLIGIREYGDPTEDNPELDRDERDEISEPVAPGLFAITEENMQASGSLTSWSDPGDDRHVCQVDFWAQAPYGVTYASPRFEAKFGPLQKGSSLRDLVAEGESVFWSWLEARTTAVLAGDEMPRIQGYGPLTLMEASGGAALHAGASGGNSGLAQWGKRCAPRLVTVSFPDPVTQGTSGANAQMGRYRVSLRVGRRQGLPGYCVGSSGSTLSSGTSAFTERRPLVDLTSPVPPKPRLHL